MKSIKPKDLLSVDLDRKDLESFIAMYIKIHDVMITSVDGKTLGFTEVGKGFKIVKNDK